MLHEENYSSSCRTELKAFLGSNQTRWSECRLCLTSFIMDLTRKECLRIKPFWEGEMASASRAQLASLFAQIAVYIL